MITKDQIQEVYTGLLKAHGELYRATENEIKAKNTLENFKLKALSEGKIDGKNAEIREANARALLSGAYELLEKAEEETRSRKFTYDVEKMGLDELKMLIRVDELLAQK